jgi:hypothetical protein
MGACGFSLSAPPSLPSIAGSWLTGEIRVDVGKPKDYHDRKLENRKIFEQVDEKSSLEDEAQTFRFSSKLVQRAKSGARGLGRRKSWLMPHNLR